MVDFRTTHEGSLIAPHRGRVPPAPDGYERDFGNPFLFHPRLSPCENRVQKIYESGCCGKYVRTYCTVLNCNVTRSMCKSCQEDSEWLERYISNYGVGDEDS